MPKFFISSINLSSNWAFDVHDRIIYEVRDFIWLAGEILW